MKTKTQKNKVKPAWRIGESKVFQELLNAGFMVKWAKIGSGADFILDDGRLIECKFSHRRPQRALKGGEVDTDVFSVIKKMRHKNGHRKQTTFSHIAKVLNSEGYTTIRGKPFVGSTVASVLRRAGQYMPTYKSLGWHFNFHHHGKRQQNVDFFICIAHEDGHKDKIFVIPALLHDKQTFSISGAQMERGRYDYFDRNFELIKINREKT